MSCAQLHVLHVFYDRQSASLCQQPRHEPVSDACLRRSRAMGAQGRGILRLQSDPWPCCTCGLMCSECHAARGLSGRASWRRWHFARGQSGSRRRWRTVGSAPGKGQLGHRRRGVAAPVRHQRVAVGSWGQTVRSRGRVNRKGWPVVSVPDGLYSPLVTSAD